MLVLHVLPTVTIHTNTIPTLHKFQIPTRILSVIFSCWIYWTKQQAIFGGNKMSTFWLRIMFALLVISMAPLRSVGEFEQWCIADEQTPDEELQMALDWACGKGGADCSMIQVNKPCYSPNTVRDHASYAFNSYFQKFKHKGGSCFFKGAALITELDPSYNFCHYEFIP